jgi:arabinose-5-phosphate isomerase
VLLLPRASEACPHGLAPTTSTLLQLVMGDALAIALLEARGFTPDHFRTFHPGGQLGANLTRISEIMRVGDQIPLVRLGTGMPEAVMTLSQKKVGCVCVVDDEGRLAGIVTDGDLARNLNRNLADTTVDEIMTRAPKTIEPTMFAGAAIALINKHNISALVVTEAGKPIGVVHFHDLLRIGAA